MNKGFTQHHKDRIRKSGAGFTLVEILVTMAIVAIVGTILVTIFTNTLRGSNKSQILAVIKQNGQAVLDNMDKTIRGADNVVCPQLPSPPAIVSSNTLVVVTNGTYTRYRITLEPSDHSINGYIQQDNPAKQDVAGSSPLRKETESEFVSRVCNIADPMTQIVILTDTNLQSGVSVTTGSFTKNPQSGYKDSVTVSFTLGPGVNAPAVIAGQIDPVVFKTTVGLR
ncbi:type II secretion system protein [Candidatus Daviesbacteria bacterium]|nr:type II secretion system protein [Candidatus Daviesbacteria bacterium]